jgi:hypothetical protein
LTELGLAQEVAVLDAAEREALGAVAQSDC